jgi:3-hydroxyisobutyrate dehydrogenase-like beta-hydroxyacid dehydrogenase
MVLRMGFIGFGEAAAVFAKPIMESGVQVNAYDVLLSQTKGKEILENRARGMKLNFLNLPEMIEQSNYLISTVTTQVAKQVATDCSGYLKSGQVFIDLNSTAPAIKNEINEIILKTGADFVEGAVLGAVGATGASTKILFGGIKAEETTKVFKELGLNVAFFSEEIGKASQFKMLRSIYSKGLEALLLELLISGEKAGIKDELWDDIVQLMKSNSFEKTASNWIRTHALACERRYYEMAQVVETMKELNLEPILTTGTVNFFKRSVTLGFKDNFTEKPLSVNDVIDFMAKKIS